MRPYHELDVFLTWGAVPGGAAQSGNNSDNNNDNNNATGTSIGNGNGYYSGADIGDRQPLPGESAAIAYMQAAVAAFVRDPRGGLSRFGWPQYKPDSMCPFSSHIFFYSCFLGNFLMVFF